MTTDNEADRFQPQRDLLNRTGLPFQLAVEREFCRIGPSFSFRLLGREIPWQRGFLDLLGGNGRAYLGIECKRVDDQAWTFVVTDDTAMRQTRCRLEWYNPKAEDLHASTVNPSGVFCSEFNIVEPSPESELCAIPKGGSVNTLETVAADVVAACHDILDRPDLRHATGEWQAIVPVVVTTARLTVCLLDPSRVDKSTGKMSRDGSTFQDVPWVRFRKTLVDRRSNTWAQHRLYLQAWIEDRERTVFIVRPEALGHFLSGFRAFRCQDPGGIPKEFVDPEILEWQGDV